MRIPDGDLVPARRHRYRGGYGYRRQRRVRRFALLAAVLLAVAAGGLWLTRKGSPAVVVARCPKPSASPAPVFPAPQQVRLQLLNGTPRNGLAKQVADALGARGFVVVSPGNAPSAQAGSSVVRYGAGALAAARVLSFHVLGSTVVADPHAPAGSVTVVLGGDFQRLATPAEVTAAEQAARAPAAGSRPSTGPSSPACAR